MRQLACEMCGSTDLIKQDGVFVCQSCGTKYSVEEAKKMMVEGTVEVTGTVKVDDSSKIENYYMMAENAYDASNQKEAENYCNKIIEIDPNNYRAWMLKGKAIAWQSSLQNSRVDEGVTAFIKAIDNAPGDVKGELVEEAKGQIKKLSLAMISLRADRFAKWPDEEEANGFISDIASILSTAITFLSQTGTVIPLSEIMAPIASSINQSVVRAWQNVILPEYSGDSNDPDDRAGKFEWQKFIKRIGYCTSLVEKAISFCDEDDEDNIQRYENLIYLHNQAIDSCSWKWEFIGSSKYWTKEWELTDEAKSLRRQRISQYEAKIAEIKSAKEKKDTEESIRRTTAYWEEHAETKTFLECGRSTLEKSISTLEEEILNIPGENERKCIQAQIDTLTAEQKALGLFKGKEKKILQEKINAANSELEALTQKMNSAEAELKLKILHLRQCIDRVNEELNSPMETHISDPTDSWKSKTERLGELAQLSGAISVDLAIAESETERSILSTLHKICEEALQKQEKMMTE